MNRELVERATHPEALEEVVLALGDEWRVHANNVEGGQLADGLTAGKRHHQARQVLLHGQPRRPIRRHGGKDSDALG